VRRTDKDVDRLDHLLGQMRLAHETHNVALFAEADIAFHDVILKATGNIFVGVLFDPLSKVMQEKREQTSAVHQIQANAIAKHEAVLDAVRSGDAEGARLDHMVQTSDDLQHYVLDAGKL
jgi:DNA-binding FadR family transcriptional regulator